MKTYPFIRVLIKLHWLLLLILMGFLMSFFIDPFSSSERGDEVDSIPENIITTRATPLTDVEKKGKNLFKINCASCHH